MATLFEIRWEGELPARQEDVWDGITRHTDAGARRPRGRRGDLALTVNAAEQAFLERRLLE